MDKSICFIAPFMGSLLEKSGTHGTGGAERQFFLFGQELAKRGWRVSFIVDCPHDLCILPNGMTAVHASFRHMGGSAGHLLPETCQFMRALQRADATFYVIKTAAHLMALVQLYQLVNRRGNLIVWGQTSTSFDRMIPGEPRWLQMIRGYGIRNARYLIAQTCEQAEHARRDFHRRAVIIPNITIPPTPGVSCCIEQDYILWCGNSHANKRYEIFLELARLLPQRKFVMAMNPGDPTRCAAAQRDAAELSNVRFLGSVPSQEMDDWFAHASVYVNTSVREGFPNTYLQAFQQGCPVVAVNIDPDGIIRKYGLGYCLNETAARLDSCAIGTAARLAPLVEAICGQPAERARLSLACRTYVLRTHTPDRVIPLLENILCG